MAFTDGKTVAHMPFSCDHKPIFDGNAGPTPAAWAPTRPPAWLRERRRRRDPPRRHRGRRPGDGVRRHAVRRRALSRASSSRADGPRVIEFNARFGDPEAECLLPLLQSDLLEIMLACADGTLDKVDVRWPTTRR